MRILQISAGPNPDAGRSNAYLDRLPPALAALGHDVTTLNMAGVGGWFGGPRLETGGGAGRTLTIVNSRAYAGLPPGGGQGSARPLRDAIPSPELRQMVGAIARDLRPEIAHVQNLFGFPGQLVRDLQQLGIPVVFTAHDYFAICPTSHRFLPHEGRPCNLGRDELVCRRCCAASQPYPVFRTVLALEARLRDLPAGSWRWQTVARTRNLLLRANRAVRRAFTRNEPYRRRFDLMREVLHAFDAVHCISRTQAARLEAAVGKLARLQVLPLVPPTVTRLSPIPRDSAGGAPLRFAVLNVFPEREDKGWSLLRAALADLEADRRDFQVDWYADGPDTACIRFHGRYRHAELDRIAAQADFCIIPSLWYETLGFTGVEMLARGVPLIVSDRCGVSEWVRHGETGLIFDPSAPAALRTTLAGMLDAPALARSTRQAQSAACAAMLTFDDHVKAMSSLLAGVARSGPPVS